MRCAGAHVALGAGVLALASVSFSHAVGGEWRGANGKWYSKLWAVINHWE